MCHFSIILLSVTVGSLILHQRYRKRQKRYQSLSNDVASTFDEHTNETTENDTDGQLSTRQQEEVQAGRREICGGLPTIAEGCCEDSPVVDIEDILSPSRRTSTPTNIDDGFVCLINVSVIF